MSAFTELPTARTAGSGAAPVGSTDDALGRSRVLEDDDDVVRLEVDVADMKDEIERALALTEHDDDDDDDGEEEGVSRGGAGAGGGGGGGSGVPGGRGGDDPYGDLMPSINTILAGLRQAGIHEGGDGGGGAMEMSVIAEEPSDGLLDESSRLDGGGGGGGGGDAGSDGYSEDGAYGGKRSEGKAGDSDDDDDTDGAPSDFRPLLRSGPPDAVTTAPSVASDPGAAR